MFEGVVDCAESELRVGGKDHSNVVEFVTIEYSFTAVEVTEVGGRLQINEELLPGACTRASGGCELVISASTVGQCRYAEVKRASFQRFQHGGKKLLVNDEQKILLEERGEEPLPADCRGKGVMRRTNFPGLFIYHGEPEGETVFPMQSREIDLEWEARVTAFYMEYWALSLDMEGRAE